MSAWMRTCRSASSACRLASSHARELSTAILLIGMTSVPTADGSSGQKDVDRPSHGAAAERRRGATTADKSLVDVVTQDCTEASTILTAERARERLGKGIADRVGVAQAFAFDELYGVINVLKRRYDEAIHGR